MNKKPDIPDLPPSTSDKLKWSEALAPRMNLAEWVVNQSDQEGKLKLEASDLLTEYFRRCPPQFSDLRRIASEEVIALDLAIGEGLLDHLNDNRKKYDAIRKKLEDASS